jgi:isocitrate lyase
MLYGILLPAPIIAEAAPGLLNRLINEGHEVGLHGWDHVFWHDRVRHLDRESTARQLTLAAELFKKITGLAPASFAAPGWQVSADALEIMAELGISHISCTRGRSPFLTMAHGRVLPLLELPTTLPTADEVLSRPEVTPANLGRWLAERVRPGELNVLTLHAEVEGRELLPAFREFLTILLARGARFPRLLDAARAAGDKKKEEALIDAIDNFQTHVVPIIADIDAGFGNAEATYLLAKKMIEAGACALQIENQVSDEKQCGHQDGKVTVPHEDFLQKVRACRYAFLELGVDNGIIVTRTDSLGAGLTKQIAVSHQPGDLGDQYNSFLDCEEITPENARNGDVVLNRNGKLLRPKRLPSNLFQFRSGTGEDRCVLDSITSLQNGADLLWIETEKPHVEQIAGMMDRIREVIPNAKLVYNNSPSFNWTLNFRQQVYDAWAKAGKDVSAYDRAGLMSVDYDGTELAAEADERIRTFQADGAKRAGIFHHLITLPTYHTAALSTDNLAKEYFGAAGMLGYVAGVQRQEIRQGIACVKHQNMSGSDIGDDHKEYFAGEAALKAGGAHNTMNQFA